MKPDQSAWALWLNVYKGHPALAVRERQVLHGFYSSKAACDLAGKHIAKSLCNGVYTVTHECAEESNGKWEYKNN
jgi:hypothetical protein